MSQGIKIEIAQIHPQKSWIWAQAWRALITASPVAFRTCWNTTAPNDLIIFMENRGPELQSFKGQQFVDVTETDTRHPD